MPKIHAGLKEFPLIPIDENLHKRLGFIGAATLIIKHKFVANTKDFVQVTLLDESALGKELTVAGRSHMPSQMLCS